MGSQGMAPLDDVSGTPRDGWSFEELLTGLALHFFSQLNLTADADRQLADLDLDLGRTHHRVLYICSQKPGVTSGEITRILRITNQALNRPMRELIDGGLVEQKVSSADRRQRLHYATDAGKELFERLAKLQTERLNRAFEAAGPAAVEGFYEVLSHVATSEDLEFINENFGGYPRSGTSS